MLAIWLEDGRPFFFGHLRETIKSTEFKCWKFRSMRRDAHLMKDGFVQRYDPATAPDGLKGDEGAFLACSFWMVSCLHLLGRQDEARGMFERLLALRNDVGLLSEEYDPVGKRMLGNFPQALSHITLIHAAFTLTGRWQPEPYTGSD